MMMVEEKVKAIAIYIETILEKPKARHIKYPIIKVNKTCPIPVIKEIFPTSLIVFGFRWIPTINNKKAIPNCEKTSRVSKSGKKFNKKGPTRIPEKI